MSSEASGQTAAAQTAAAQHSLCFVVPCYNEEDALPYFVEAMAKVEGTLSDRLARPFTFVFVDDGSADGTLAVLKDLNKRDERYHYVSFSRNFGKEAGLIAGLERSLTYDVTDVVVMDVDLQDPPELLGEMLDRMDNEGCDIVATYRESRKGEPPIRSWFAHRFYGIMNGMSDVEMRDGARDFRVMRREVVQSICSMPERERFSKGLFAWVGFKTEWIGYENIEREHGQTSWSFMSLFRYAIDGMVAFSKVPLEALSAIGLLVFAIAIIFLLFILIRAAIFGDPVAGWPSLVCIVTLLSGIQIFGMGVLGLYLSKIYSEVKGRPHYLVREER